MKNPSRTWTKIEKKTKTTMLSPTEKKVARDIIRRYCERCEANKRTIHYSQARPMRHLGVAPGTPFTTDCSGFVTSAFFWAERYTTFPVRDPNGRGYDGWGYTGTLLVHNVRRRVPLDRNFFFVGDMVLYGSSYSNTKHVAICRKNGSAATSVWTSHGSELGPYPVRIDYRSDVLIVVRSESLV